MPIGIVTSNTSPQSFLRLEREWIVFPLAASTNYFSAASSGGASATFSITSAVAGTAIPLSAPGGRPLRHARRPVVTITDAASADLACTVRVIGKRFGVFVTQDFVLAAGGTAAITGTRVLDEVTSAFVVSISGAAASDTVAIGFDAKRIGLSKPIRNVKSVKLVEKIASSTPSSANIRAGSEVQIAAVTGVQTASIDVSTATMFSADIVATDIYYVEYLAGSLDEFTPLGRKFG
jgi:hypothetical protein